MGLMSAPIVIDLPPHATQPINPKTGQGRSVHNTNDSQDRKRHSEVILSATNLESLEIETACF